MWACVDVCVWLCGCVVVLLGVCVGVCVWVGGVFMCWLVVWLCDCVTLCACACVCRCEAVLEMWSEWKRLGLSSGRRVCFVYRGGVVRDMLYRVLRLMRNVAL